MRSRTRALAGAWTGLAAVLGLAGCAANPAPAGWLPRVAGVPQDFRGAWIVVDRQDSAGSAAGELISVRDDGVSILTRQGLVDVPSRTIRRATVAIHAPDSPPVAWSALGAVSTISHGYYLLFTLPIWIGVGTATAAAESKAPLLVHPPAKLASFRRYARFPQGMPPGMDPAALGSLSEKERPPVRD